MNPVKVLFFATLRDSVGTRSVDIDLPAGTTIAGLEELLVARYPHLEKMRGSMLAAVDRVYAAREQVIPENAEIAFFPPVSGG